jgi:hypothetical protein
LSAGNARWPGIHNHGSSGIGAENLLHQSRL